MLFSGLLDLPWWGLVLVALGLTHVTIASVTIYLHRNQAHRALDLHPAVAHFFRCWLWLTTGMVSRYRHSRGGNKSARRTLRRNVTYIRQISSSRS